ncbi:hypothetical protein [Streptomyces sp. NPDC051546]|uniref:hypothetical protein n=1 Tax=Streptomyces sp. NPDC051546 TaxID=3365655 RepID=UPI0037A59D45
MAERIAAAAVRERETAGPALRGGAFFEYAAEPQRLAEVWAAKHSEWQRVGDLMRQAGWSQYEPELDVQGSEWAHERTERRQAVLSVYAAHRAQRQDEQDELRAEVWLSAESGRLIRAAATRAGIRPDDLLARLAERIVVGEDGTLSVPPFSPSR